VVALGDPLAPLPGEEVPGPAGDREGQELGAEVAEEQLRDLHGRPYRVAANSRKRRSRSDLPSRSSCSSPPRASEIVPRSSDTRIASASVSSEMPIAARWRVPKRLGRPSLSDSGRKLAAAAMRSPETITAPSWSGVPGAKSVTSSSYETDASI